MMNNRFPCVSVVITTYNHARFLPIAIDSVLGQTYPAIETIVVDDGSTDDTPDLMQRYTGRVNYIRQENRGVAAARNAGIRVASGEFVNVLDSDDFFLPTKIARQIELFDERSDIGLVHCGFYQVDENGNRLNKVTSFPSEHILRELSIDCFLLVHAPLVRREWLDRVGLFDEHLPWTGQYCEDWDLWLRMSKAGCQFAYTREPLIGYRIVKGSQMTNAPKMEWGSIGVLDRFFGKSDLPADVIAVRGKAYGLRRLWIGFDYVGSCLWDDAKRNFAEAIAADPTLTNDPALALQNIIDCALMPRVKDPLAFVGAVLVHLPPAAETLRGYGPYLQSRVKTSLALQAFAAGDVDQAQKQIIDAIKIDASFMNRLDEFRETLGHYSMNLPISNPASFVEMVFGNLPVEAERLKSVRSRALSDVNLASAFEDYSSRQWTRTIQHVISAARYYPGVLKNRGALSILLRSVIKWLKGSKRD